MPRERGGSACRPASAIASDTPTPKVVARHVARGVHVVRSDESGAAQWQFKDGGKASLHRWRALAHRYWHNDPGGGAQLAESKATDDTAEAADNDVAEPTPF